MLGALSVECISREAKITPGLDICLQLQINPWAVNHLPLTWKDYLTCKVFEGEGLRVFNKYNSEILIGKLMLYASQSI